MKRSDMITRIEREDQQEERRETIKDAVVEVLAFAMIIVSVSAFFAMVYFLR
jgi:uncharacterized membrane protein YidH (DUF202 family)